jgi:hypothetical protein
MERQIEKKFVFHSNTDDMILDKSKIFNKVDYHKRKTKIICTLG